MKKGFLILLFFVLAISGWHGYERWQKEQQTAEHLTGSLSDIAEEVVAIPLQQPAGAAPITTARDIRKDGNDLFLISRNTLYHFDRQGKFISQVTRPEDIQVAGYVIDALRRQLIVLGNENDIHYYTYEGKEKSYTTGRPGEFMPRAGTKYTAQLNFIGDSFVLNFVVDNGEFWENGGDSDLTIQ